MDILGPFNKSAKGHQYILVVTDPFTKFCQAVPMTSTTAAAVAQAFLQSSIYPYGIPLYFLTDKGADLSRRFSRQVAAC